MNEPLPATWILVVAMWTAWSIPASITEAVQIGDLVRIKGSEQNKLVGMGLVVGLKGTGDGGKFRPAMEPLARVVRHFINESSVAADLKDAKNVALVALEATTPAAGSREGDRVDVYVSAVGSAKSLAGGRLLLMPMTGPLPDSAVFAYASGAVTIEGDGVPTTGVVRNGAQLVGDIRARFIDESGRMTLVLKDANATFQIASTVAATVNSLNPDGERIAVAADAKNVVIDIPRPELRNPAQFIAAILSQYLDRGFIETGARVRINEKTGTIVLTGDVEISPVVIMHGGLTITMITPPPVPTKETPRVEEQTVVGIETGDGTRGGIKLASLIAAFNQLKIGVKDRITIVKEIHSLGKLHADLVFE